MRTPLAKLACAILCRLVIAAKLGAGVWTWAARAR